MLELQQVGYRYPGAEHDALVDASLRLEPGQCLGLLGANGAGKTTALSLIAGLLQPGSGTILRPAQGRIGLVPQTLAFHGRLSTKENLELFADLYRLSGQLRHQQLDTLIHATRLEPLLGQKAGSMSGGQQRRLNFALGLLQPAELYLLDEATVGVDSINRQYLLQAVRGLTAAGKMVIYTSHYLPEIEQVADRVVLLAEGQVQLDTTLQEQDSPRRLVIRWPGPVPEAIALFLRQHAADWQQMDDDTIQAQLASEAYWPDLLQLLACQNVAPTHLEYRRPGLEELYLRASRGHL